MKKQLKKLTQKLTLATTLALTSLQTQAQNPDTQALHFMGNSMQHNAHFMKDIEQARQYHALGRILHDTAHLVNIYEMENTQYNSTNTTQQTPTANFYIYNYWNDFDNDKIWDIPEELIGRNKSSFWEDEKIQLGIETSRLKGNKAHLELFNPNGERFYSNSKIIQYPGDVRNWSYSEGTSKTIQKHGQGIYSAKFFINNQHIGTRKFALKSNIQMDLCNYWKDLDGDSLIDREKEFSGLSKRSFNENESLMSLLFVRNQKGKKVNLKLFDPKGEEILSNTGTITGNSQWHHFKRDVSDLTSIHGPGTYLAAFYLDGESKGAISFELKGNQKPKNLEGYFLDGKFYPREQKTTSMSQKEKNYYEQEKAMHREQNLKHKTQPSKTQPSLLQKQKQKINSFRETIIQRANVMNRGNPKRRADPIGYNLSDKEILELHGTYGNFSEQSIRKFIKP